MEPVVIILIVLLVVVLAGGGWFFSNQRRTTSANWRLRGPSRSPGATHGGANHPHPPGDPARGPAFGGNNFPWHNVILVLVVVLIVILLVTLL